MSCVVKEEPIRDRLQYLNSSTHKLILTYHLEVRVLETSSHRSGATLG